MQKSIEFFKKLQRYFDVKPYGLSGIVSDYEIYDINLSIFQIQMKRKYGFNSEKEKVTNYLEDHGFSLEQEDDRELFVNPDYELIFQILELDVIRETDYVIEQLINSNNIEDLKIIKKVIDKKINNL